MKWLKKHVCFDLGQAFLALDLNGTSGVKEQPVGEFSGVKSQTRGFNPFQRPPESESEPCVVYVVWRG